MTLFKERNPGFYVVKGPPGSPESFIIPDGDTRFRVGREPPSDLVFKSDYISANHIAFWREGEEAYAQDQKSKNSSKYNDEIMKSEKPYLLREGDLISLADGDAILKFSKSIQAKSSSSAAVHEAPQVQEGIFVDSLAHEIYVDGNQVEPRVVGKEFQIIERLFQKKGLLVAMEEIKTAGWPEREEVFPAIEGKYGGIIQEEYRTNSTQDDEIHQVIKRLREHLKGAHKTQRIQNIRGKGYKLV